MEVNNDIKSTYSKHSEGYKQKEKVAKDFEEVFLSNMLNSAMKDIKFSESDGPDSDIYKSWIINEYAKSIAQDSPGIGLSDQILKFLLKSKN